jgi:hypothetical protein
MTFSSIHRWGRWGWIFCRLGSLRSLFVDCPLTTRRQPIRERALCPRRWWRGLLAPSCTGCAIFSVIPRGVIISLLTVSPWTGLPVLFRRRLWHPRCSLLLIMPGGNMRISLALIRRILTLWWRPSLTGVRGRRRAALPVPSISVAVLWRLRGLPLKYVSKSPANCVEGLRKAATFHHVHPLKGIPTR